MGHFHSRNLDTLFMKRLYAKGKISQEEIVNLALEKQEYVHASEGSYEAKYMIQSGISTLFALHYASHDIEPVVTTEEQRKLIERWDANDEELLQSWGDDGESIGDLKALEQITFRFAPGKRNQYLDLVIGEVDV